MGNVNGPTSADALRALNDRGVNGAHDLLELGTPDQILAACHRWDGQRGVTPGLLVAWIRRGEFDDPDPGPRQDKAAVLRVRFDAYARRYPEGAVTESHVELGVRRSPDDQIDCPGRLVVYDATYPVIAVECDRCGFDAAYPVRSLHVLAPAIHPVPPPVEAPTRGEMPF